MTLNDIDKQALKEFEKKHSMWVDGGGSFDLASIQECVSFMVKMIDDGVSKKIDQAKAEQKEEDARVAEGKKRKLEPHIKLRDSGSWIDVGFNEACDDIAQAIRGAK